MEQVNRLKLYNTLSMTFMTAISISAVVVVSLKVFA